MYGGTQGQQLRSVVGRRMGGDRDGNPYVTPSTTRDVVITARLAATNLYFKAVEKLMYELSVWRSSDEARVRLLSLKPELCRTLHLNSRPPLLGGQTSTGAVIHESGRGRKTRAKAVEVQELR